MTGVIYFLILFFIFLIIYQLFLAHFSYIEGLTTDSTSSTDIGTITTVNSTSSEIPSPIINDSTINASAINSDNIAYIPYTSTSESVPSLVGQNTNNILYLKHKMDTLFQQVQDISGNVTSISTIQANQSEQFNNVGSALSQAQSQMPKTPPEITGLI